MNRPWTLEELREANAMPAERWADARHCGEQLWKPCFRDDWRWIIFAQRLVWTYGEVGALERLNTPLQVAA